MMTKRREDPLCWDSADDREALLGLLRDDAVVISSTDTIYGFLGSLSERSYDSIMQLKQTKQRRPFLVLVSSIDKVKDFVEPAQLTDQVNRFISSCWPGPVTFIFASRKDLPPFLSSDEGTIAVRCPDHKGLLALLSKVDGLLSTSANRSGEEPPKELDEIDAQLIEQVPAIVIDSEGGEQLASTIIDLSRGVMHVVREGSFQIEKLKELYEQSR